MDARSSKSDVRSELRSIKQDMLQLVTSIDRIVERIVRLDSSFEASSRKRLAPKDVDSDAFSEDDQSVLPKLLKIEPDVMGNLNRSSNNNNNSLGLNSGGNIKAEVCSKPFLANATKPVAIPRPSTSKTAFPSSSTSSFSSSSSDSSLISKPAVNSSYGQLNYENNRVIVFTDGSCTNNGKATARGGTLSM